MDEWDVGMEEYLRKSAWYFFLVNMFNLLPYVDINTIGQISIARA